MKYLRNILFVLLALGALYLVIIWLVFGSQIKIEQKKIIEEQKQPTSGKSVETNYFRYEVETTQLVDKIENQRPTNGSFLIVEIRVDNIADLNTLDAASKELIEGAKLQNAIHFKLDNGACETYLSAKQSITLGKHQCLERDTLVERLLTTNKDIQKKISPSSSLQATIVFDIPSDLHSGQLVLEDLVIPISSKSLLITF